MDTNVAPTVKEGAAGAAATEGTDGEEDTEDEPSSSSSIQQELEQFRYRWRSELDSSPHHSQAKNVSGNNNINSLAEDAERDIIGKAKQLFLQGVCAEQEGSLFEAIQFYRRAIQLVPDIELRIYENVIPKPPRERLESETSQCESVGHVHADDDDCEDFGDIEDLVTRFHKQVMRTEGICEPDYEQKMTHISSLPSEVILYIFKWVVSAELDLRSLEQLAIVCRGFYLCARDPELWRLACLRVWGVNTGLASDNYESWRSMFITRPRLRYNGAYISKTTYLRHGENSFQDQFYRPWHMVAYFRYIRFFPDGIVLMMTTPDDPYSSLVKLRYRVPKHAAVLVGHYRLHGSSVIAVLKRPKSIEQANLHLRYKRGQRRNSITDAGEQTFHLELDIRDAKKGSNFQLAWARYAIYTVYSNGNESISELDLMQNNFPSFWFSRVKSYTSESESPLQ